MTSSRVVVVACQVVASSFLEDPSSLAEASCLGVASFHFEVLP
jgi:hypothetical protein